MGLGGLILCQSLVCHRLSEMMRKEDIAKGKFLMRLQK